MKTSQHCSLPFFHLNSNQFDRHITFHNHFPSASVFASLHYSLFDRWRLVWLYAVKRERWKMITSCLIRIGLRVPLVKLNRAAVKQGSVVWKCFRPTVLLSKQAAWAAVVKSGLFEQVWDSMTLCVRVWVNVCVRASVCFKLYSIIKVIIWKTAGQFGQ